MNFRQIVKLNCRFAYNIRLEDVKILLQLIQYLCIGLFAGLLSWNVLDCHVDLEEELNNLLNHGPEGELARHGTNIFFLFLTLAPT